MVGFLTKFIGDSNEKAISKLRPLVAEIKAREPEFEQLSDEELRATTQKLKARLAEGRTLDDIMADAFAATREASRRTLKMRHFDVQMIGGAVLHSGKIAEMRTGEGKTLVATLPAYLNALTGEGVHVITVNDYLAKRDASWMAVIYSALGLTVGCLQNESSLIYDPSAKVEATSKKDKDGAAIFAAVAGESMRPCSRREAYAADITYGTNHEFGFDYLRDNMVEDTPRMVQRGLAFAIVDEVDNILIDEARTPLIISGPARESGSEYRRFSALAKRLEKQSHYTIDEKQRQISLTSDGIAMVEKLLNVENLYDPQHDALTHFVENAVRAEALYQKDRDYVVQDGEILIVDEFTGRLMTGRRWSDGLHQAVEAKEGVEVRRETITYATITLQNYFRMYRKLAGMTGTANTEAEEFFKIYKLEVVLVPTNKPMVRVDGADLIFKTEQAKWDSAANKIKELHQVGRPTLVGTTSIEKSEMLAALLKRKGVPHEVLNAKQHEREAHVVAQAGRAGSVTVATNMAGRGTDIILGGNPDALGIPREEWQTEHDRVVSLGGLFVLGTERHEARRIDNQLRGRTGRQGDPGETQFYVSTEDDLIRRFGGDRIKGAMNLLGWEDDVPIENRMVSKSVEAAQTRVEGHHFEMRKHLVDYDDVVNTHRDVIYKLRRRVLHGENLRPTVTEYVNKELADIVAARLKGDSSSWDVPGFQKELGTVFPVQDVLKTEDDILGLQTNEVESQVLEYAEKTYDQRELEFGPETMRQLERAIMLRTIDQEWVEHLTAMENFRQGIGLEAVGQRDPLVQYKRAAYDMFQALVTRVQSNVARTIFRVALSQPAAQGQGQQATRATVAQAQARAVPGQAPAAISRGQAVPATGPAPAASSAKAAQVISGRPSVMASVARGHGMDTGAKGKVGRNDPCTCGSGKKYKKCHGTA
ncbi:MAG: preprotein translocase subunit SecA [Dehalococcoidia bacterium]|nr:preprotein translocase subunit SecA [Dehalococcoidia bacterium]